MNKDLKGRDPKTLINVFAEGCIEDHPSVPFEHFKGVNLYVDYYPHAEQLRTYLISHGFEPTELEFDMYGMGPSSTCSRVGYWMELKLRTEEDRDELRKLLDSEVYNLVFE
jgi:hypothetical protein